MSGKCLGLQMSKERFHTSIIQAVPFTGVTTLELQPARTLLIYLMGVRPPPDRNGILRRVVVKACPAWQAPAQNSYVMKEHVPQ